MDENAKKNDLNRGVIAKMLKEQTMPSN